MTSTQSSGLILKTDSLARIRTSRQRKQELLDEFERSGLSGPKFAALVGVKYSTFAAWAARRKRAGSAAAAPSKGADPAAPVRWLEAVVDQAKGSSAKEDSALTLQFGHAAQAEIVNTKQAELAAALLLALNQFSRC